MLDTVIIVVEVLLLLAQLRRRHIGPVFRCMVHVEGVMSGMMMVWGVGVWRPQREEPK